MSLALRPHPLGDPGQNEGPFLAKETPRIGAPFFSWRQRYLGAKGDAHYSTTASRGHAWEQPFALAGETWRETPKPFRIAASIFRGD
ncbi:hypothetical protein NDU88_005672 [Pleurodeles waltl]|uniref:Uncharacterized protein n=1 Tax=Pleurodeles waltl TaxID=8319 RepID=A0AAV7VKJ5_PLEWA|nr:hypothetical protein NDU88_005672 [Pleurodeles waltl]